MHLTKTQIVRISTLITGCLVMTMGGTVGSFNAYSNTIKEKYGLRQSHIELMASLMNLGLATSVPAGYFVEKCGPRWTAILSIILGLSVYVLLYASTLNPPFYLENFFIMGIYSYFVGFASIFMIMNAVTINIDNYQPVHRGKSMGLIQACFWLGAAIFAGIYGSVFKPSSNVGGYFLTLAVVLTIINFVAIFTLRSQPPEYSQMSETELTNAADEEYTSENKSKEFIAELKGFKLFKCVDFHLIVWPFITCAAVELLFIYNLSTFLKSFKLRQFETALTVLGPVVGCISKLYHGCVSDWTMKKCPRITHLAIANGLQLFSLLLCVFLADHFIVILLTTVLVYNANGANMSLVPTIIGDCFGVRYFGQNWGWSQPGFAIIGWILQALLGYFYDHQINLQYTTDCFGLKCFIIIFWITIVLNLGSLCVNVAFYIRQKNRIASNDSTYELSETGSEPNNGTDDRARPTNLTDYQTLSKNSLVDENNQ